MIEDLHTDDDLPITAATGWAEMHSLLNKEMPVRRFKRRFVLFSLVPIAAMLLILMVVSLKLNHEYYLANFYHQTGNEKSIVNTIRKEISESFHQFSKKTTNQLKKPAEVNNKVIAANQTVSLDKTDSSTSYLFSRLIALPEKSKTIFRQASIINPINNPGAPMKPSFKKWSINAGAAINIATTSNQNFQPYPFVSVKYHLSEKLFLSSGLAIFSPAPGSVSGVSKISPVNDVISNTSQYDEITHYRHLKYADVPVTLGMQLNKNISVQAGIQSSLLLSKQTSKEKIAYDFQMNRIEVSAMNPVYAPAAMPEKLYDVKMPTMDYRVISGINYQINKTAISVYYQHSLRKSTIPNNNLFSLQLSWQIK